MKEPDESLLATARKTTYYVTRIFGSIIKADPAYLHLKTYEESTASEQTSFIDHVITELSMGSVKAKAKQAWYTNDLTAGADGGGKPYVDRIRVQMNEFEKELKLDAVMRKHILSLWWQNAELVRPIRTKIYEVESVKSSS